MSCMQSLSLLKSRFGRTSQPASEMHILSEIFPHMAIDVAAIGYVRSRLPRTDAPILWVQDRLSCRETGRPYLAGMGVNRPIIIAHVSRAADVLWALEDGLRCRALGAVVGEIWGDPPALDFTATKRLAMRSEASGVPCWLVRHAATPNLSAARDRWRIASLPSAPNPYDAGAPGNSRWSLNLFRSRQIKPSQWTVTYDRAADRLDHAASLRDGAMGADNGTSGRRAIG